MRINDIHAFQPPTPDAPADWRTQLGQIFVRVQTDAGITGVGVGGGGAAAVHVIRTVLRDLLVGRDPTDVERLHQQMCDHTVFYGRKGIAVMAISGVDLALWDLRGKHAGKPVAQLLDSEVDLSRAIPTYSTVMDERAACQAIESGQSAVKLHGRMFGEPGNRSSAVDSLRRIRQKLGKEGMLMIDGFGSWDVATTLEIAESIADANVAWIEEPLPPDRLDDYQRLVELCDVPIAGGEHEYLLEGFEPLIERRLHAVLQPDINWCGGMTTLVQIYRLAQQAGLGVCPHRGSEPFALHAIAALDNNPLAESARPWFPFADGTLAAVQQGVVQLSDRPGFGV